MTQLYVFHEEDNVGKKEDIYFVSYMQNKLEGQGGLCQICYQIKKKKNSQRFNTA